MLFGSLSMLPFLLIARAPSHENPLRPNKFCRRPTRILAPSHTFEFRSFRFDVSALDAAMLTAASANTAHTAYVLTKFRKRLYKKVLLARLVIFVRPVAVPFGYIFALYKMAIPAASAL